MQSNKATQIRLELTSDLQKWRAFLAIAELGSLTRAALFLDSNQSLLSRHLNALERECKARLFNRTGRGVTLSDVGQRIFPLVKSLLSDAEQLEAEIHGEAREPAGRVTLGSLPSITNPMVGRLFKLLRDKHPGVQLKVLEGSSGQVEEWLADGRVDIAILYRYGNAQPENEQALATVDSYLIGAMGDRLTAAPEVAFSSLHELPFILPGVPNGLRTVLDAMARQEHITLDRGRFVAADALHRRGGQALHRAAAACGLDRGEGRQAAGREDRVAEPSAHRVDGIGAHQGACQSRLRGGGRDRWHRRGKRTQRHVAHRRARLTPGPALSRDA